MLLCNHTLTGGAVFSRKGKNMREELDRLLEISARHNRARALLRWFDEHMDRSNPYDNTNMLYGECSKVVEETRKEWDEIIRSLRQRGVMVAARLDRRR
jgi:hypothetical protein